MNLVNATPYNTGVTIVPDTNTMTIGTTLQLQAMVHYADGTSKDVTSVPVFSLMGPLEP